MIILLCGISFLAGLGVGTFRMVFYYGKLLRAAFDIPPDSTISDWARGVANERRQKAIDEFKSEFARTWNVPTFASGRADISTNIEDIVSGETGDGREADDHPPSA
jgi:hypothetical protein